MSFSRALPRPAGKQGEVLTATSSSLPASRGLPLLLPLCLDTRDSVVSLLALSSPCSTCCLCNVQPGNGAVPRRFAGNLGGEGEVLFLLADLTWRGVSQREATCTRRSPKPSTFTLEQSSSLHKPGKHRLRAESAGCQFHWGGSSKQQG